MSRLIDVDVLMERITSINNPCILTIGKVVGVIETQPTAYNVDKVVEELEEIGKKYCGNIDCHMYQDCDGCEHKDLMECAIEIVRNGGVKNG